jgi:hypothetical protein
MRLNINDIELTYFLLILHVIRQISLFLKINSFVGLVGEGQVTRTLLEVSPFKMNGENIQQIFIEKHWWRNVFLKILFFHILCVNF